MYNGLILLYRFFNYLELIVLDFKEREKVKIAAIIDKYGPGFDEVYWEGKYDGKIEGKHEGKLEVARNLLAAGVSEDVIFQCIGISRNDLEKLKREL